MKNVVVVGAGPAGIRAVEQLVRSGLRPIWIEESPDGGGRITQRPPAGFTRDAASLYGADSGRAKRLHATLDAMKPRTDWRPDTLVWNIRPEARTLQTLTGGSQQGEIAYDALILCTGAVDRVVPMPGWTMPGVTTLGGAQVALKAQGVGIGMSPVLVGSGPLLILTALQYIKAGAKPALPAEGLGDLRPALERADLPARRAHGPPPAPVRRALCRGRDADRDRG